MAIQVPRLMPILGSTLAFVVLTTGCQRLTNLAAGSGQRSPTSSPMATAAGVPRESSAAMEKCKIQAREQLQLSDEQKAQMKALTRKELQQVEAVLDANQQQQLRQAIKADRNLKRAIATLQLPADKQQQVSSLLEQSQRQRSDLLTSEQKQHLRSALRKCRNATG
ncbi:hypothetical protein [Neosynechococcus sphagnicola]|nr:hypothetical protein [Neosynechococcus sphagnicola]